MIKELNSARTDRLADLYLRFIFIYTLYFKSDTIVYLKKNVFVNNIKLTRD